jgi:hypothetical protein
MAQLETRAPSGKNWRGLEIVHCFSQSDLDAALTRSAEVEIWLCGTGRFVLRGESVAFATDAAHAELWGNAHAELWENAHAVADGAVALRMFDSSTAKAGRQVVIQRHSRLTKISGGIQIDVELPTTAADWCAWHGVKVADGVATVYKGVNANFRSDRGADYTPGSAPVADDWDGGHKECGSGLHFSPTPWMTRDFTSPEKFVACSVRLSDMRAPQADDQYPSKIKASGCCAPCVEVDVFGKPVKASAA